MTMLDWLTVKLIRHNTRREEARDEKQRCPFHRYDSSTFLANGLSSSFARGHNGNDLDVFNF
jgi:hypothetical protein